MRFMRANTIEEELDRALADYKRKKSTQEKSPKCPQSGPCFARTYGKCAVLNDTNFRKACPFQKAVREA